MERYAGIDLASEEHRLSIVDGEGGQLEQRRIGHDEQGIAALCRRLATRIRSVAEFPSAN